MPMCPVADTGSHTQAPVLFCSHAVKQSVLVRNYKQSEVGGLRGGANPGCDRFH